MDRAEILKPRKRPTHKQSYHYKIVATYSFRGQIYHLDRDVNGEEALICDFADKALYTDYFTGEMNPGNLEDIEIEMRDSYHAYCAERDRVKRLEEGRQVAEILDV